MDRDRSIYFADPTADWRDHFHHGGRRLLCPALVFLCFLWCPMERGRMDWLSAWKIAELFTESGDVF